MNRFIIADASKCIGCRTCEVACVVSHQEHQDCASLTPHTFQPRIHVIKGVNVSTATACRQCEDAPCANVCPNGAISRDKGFVHVMQERCIGCKTCVVACPYGAMEVVVRPVIRHSGAGLNVVAEKAEANKCDLCFHRDSGPACMEVCPTHAPGLRRPQQAGADEPRETSPHGAGLVTSGMNGVQIRIRGKVQGVGFRPFVWQLAQRQARCGDVCNDGEGVLVRLAGGDDGFTAALAAHCPPLARVDSADCAPYRWAAPPQGFTIRESGAGRMRTQIVPDAATCPACLAEMNNPRARRYRYPFINCTHCGPRLTIIRAMPYDRPLTAMAPFPLCPPCERRNTAIPPIAAFTPSRWPAPTAGRGWSGGPGVKCGAVRRRCRRLSPGWRRATSWR